MYFLVSAFVPVTFSLLPRIVWGWATSGLLGFVRFLVPFFFGAREMSLAAILAPLMPLPLAVIVSAISRLCLIVGDLLGILVSWLIR